MKASTLSKARQSIIDEARSAVPIEPSNLRSAISNVGERAGMIAGAVAGAKVGAGIGLATGGVGIAATVPLAIIGAIFGKFGGATLAPTASDPGDLPI